MKEEDRDLYISQLQTNNFVSFGICNIIRKLQICRPTANVIGLRLKKKYKRTINKYCCQ